RDKDRQLGCERHRGSRPRWNLASTARWCPAPSPGRIITPRRVNACMLVSITINCQRIVNVLELWMPARKRGRKAETNRGEVGDTPMPGSPVGIVSSAHLADGEVGERSRLGVGLIVACHACAR